MSWTPHITVAAVIEQEQHFLLVEEVADGLTVFNQPAGHWERGETLIEAVQRETLEETGWHFIPQAIIGIYEYTSPINGITYLRICFCGSAEHRKFEGPLDDGIVRALWSTRPQLLEVKEKLRSPLVLKSIDDYLAGIRYPLTLVTSVY